MNGSASRLRSFFYSVPAILWQVLFLVLPLMIIVAQSFTTTGGFGLTFAKYRVLLDFAYLRVIGRSVLLALVTSISCLLCGYPVAYFIAFRAQRWRATLLFLLMLPLWTSLLVQIYAWFFLLERDGILTQLLMKVGFEPARGSLVSSSISIVMVMIYCYLPFMIMPLYSALDGIHRQIAEASADLGARPWQTFFRVIFPLSVSGIKVGLLLVMVPVFGEFSVPSLLGGGRYLYVGPLISYFALVARDIGLCAAFTCLSGIVLLGVMYVCYGVLTYLGSLWGGDEQP